MPPERKSLVTDVPQEIFLATILFVRSGNVTHPVTGSFRPEQAYLSKLVASHGLEYLGKHLPMLGQSSGKNNREAQHVVLELSAAEASLFGCRLEGLYRVAGLPPRVVIAAN